MINLPIATGNVNESTESDREEIRYDAMDFPVREKKERRHVILMNLVNERIAAVSPIALL